MAQTLAGQVLGSHSASAKVEVLSAGLVIATIGGDGEGLAGIIDGSVTQDRTAAIRTRTTLSLSDPDGIITPRSPGDALQPYGQEIRPYRGVVVDGVTIWTMLGTLPIVTAARKDGGVFTLDVEAQDRGYAIGRRLSTTGGYTIAAGTNVGTAIQAMLTSRYPGLAFNFAPTAVTLPALAYDETQDLWQAAIELAKVAGMELYFDRPGAVVMQPFRDPAVDPVTFTVTGGINLVRIGATSTNADTFSRVIVIGEGVSGSATVRATSVDNDPASPTYYLGPFGDVPKFLRSPLIMTAGQAQVIADALLTRVKGLSEQIDFEALPDPTVEAGAVTQITWDRAGVNGRYVLEAVTIPLKPDGTLQATARKRAG